MNNELSLCFCRSTPLTKQHNLSFVRSHDYFFFCVHFTFEDVYVATGCGERGLYICILRLQAFNYYVYNSDLIVCH